jgi:hypothetical protein
VSDVERRLRRPQTRVYTTGGLWQDFAEGDLKTLGVFWG